MHTPFCGRSNKMPSFFLKYVISWEIKTLPEARCKESMNGYAVKSSWSHTDHGRTQKPTMHCVLLGAQHPESELGKGSQFASSSRAETGLRQAGRAAAGQSWRSLLYLYRNRYQNFLKAQLEISWASLFIFFRTLLIWKQQVNSCFQLLLLEPANSTAWAGLQLTLVLILLLKE